MVLQFLDCLALANREFLPNHIYFMLNHHVVFPSPMFHRQTFQVPTFLFFLLFDNLSYFLTLIPTFIPLFYCFFL